MCTAEDPYGTRKRFVFCQDLLCKARPQLVLDIGCGTGTQLTWPLANAFPGIHFVGIDPDKASILYAQSLPTLPNLRFGGLDLLSNFNQADIIIASEVIEHVQQPDIFLADLRGRLTEDGKLVITVPNGHGPYEMAAAVECLLRILRIYRVMRKFKRWLFQQPAPERAVMQDSLATSPHLSFFSFSGLLQLFQSMGLRIVLYRPRSFICGFGFDKILARFSLCEWNTGIADRLPPWSNSAWMFVLTKTDTIDSPPFRRTRLSRVRRKLTEACARLD
jgi:SAM-dependent methyltransferase